MITDYKYYIHIRIIKGAFLVIINRRRSSLDINSNVTSEVGRVPIDVVMSQTEYGSINIFI